MYLFAWWQAYCQQWLPGEEVCSPPHLSWIEDNLSFWNPFTRYLGQWSLHRHHQSSMILVEEPRLSWKNPLNAGKRVPIWKGKVLVWERGNLTNLREARVWLTWEGGVVQGEQGGCAILGPSQLQVFLFSLLWTLSGNLFRWVDLNHIKTCYFFTSPYDAMTDNVH